MLEIKITVAIDYPQLECNISKDNWLDYRNTALSKFVDGISLLNGGYSELQHFGGYIMNDGTRVSEASITYTTLVDNDVNRDKTLMLAKRLKADLFQESILWTEQELQKVEFI